MYIAFKALHYYKEEKYLSDALAATFRCVELKISASTLDKVTHVRKPFQRSGILKDLGSPSKAPGALLASLVYSAMNPTNSRHPFDWRSVLKRTRKGEPTRATTRRAAPFCRQATAAGKRSRTSSLRQVRHPVDLGGYEALTTQKGQIHGIVAVCVPASTPLTLSVSNLEQKDRCQLFLNQVSYV